MLATISEYMLLGETAQTSTEHTEATEIGQGVCVNFATTEFPALKNYFTRMPVLSCWHPFVFSVHTACGSQVHRFGTCSQSSMAGSAVEGAQLQGASSLPKCCWQVREPVGSPGIVGRS